MTFERILAELLKEVTGRIRNGRITERGLARQANVSQPHVHHLLNGKRGLTPAVADKLLSALGLTFTDLVNAAANQPSLGTQGQGQVSSILVPMLEGLLGPEVPAPEAIQFPAYLPIPVSYLPPDPDLIAVRLAADPAVSPIFLEGDVVIIARGLVPPLTQGKEDIVTVGADKDSWIVRIPPSPWWELQISSESQRKCLRERYQNRGLLVGTVMLLLRGFRPVPFPSPAP